MYSFRDNGIFITFVNQLIHKTDKIAMAFYIDFAQTIKESIVLKTQK
jgi:hypothetical protein